MGGDIEIDATLPLVPVLSRARASAILTHGLTAKEPNRCFCSDCHGKGFAVERRPGSRASRRCPRCRGKGFTTVGSTKR